MIQYHRIQDDTFEIARCYQYVFHTPCVIENESHWKSVCCYFLHCFDSLLYMQEEVRKRMDHVSRCKYSFSFLKKRESVCAIKYRVSE